MGFGVMFFGVFFFTGVRFAAVGSFDFLPDIIGYLLILYGIKCASRYCADFKTARIAGYVGAVISAVMFLSQGLEMIGVYALGETGQLLVDTAAHAVQIVFIMILLRSIFSLAKEVGAEKTEKRVLMSLIVAPIFWIAYIAIGIMSVANVITDTKITSAALLCEIIYVILTATAIFSAYMWICVEGDEDMPKRNNSKSPMDYYDRRREREAAENEERRRQKAAEAAGKSVAEMYGVKKKKKKGR